MGQRELLKIDLCLCSLLLLILMILTSKYLQQHISIPKSKIFYLYYPTHRTHITSFLPFGHLVPLKLLSDFISFTSNMPIISQVDKPRPHKHPSILLYHQHTQVPGIFLLLCTCPRNSQIRALRQPDIIFRQGLISGPEENDIQIEIFELPQTLLAFSLGWWPLILLAN